MCSSLIGVRIVRSVEASCRPACIVLESATPRSDTEEYGKAEPWKARCGCSVWYQLARSFGSARGRSLHGLRFGEFWRRALTVQFEEIADQIVEFAIRQLSAGFMARSWEGSTESLLESSGRSVMKVGSGSKQAQQGWGVETIEFPSQTLTRGRPFGPDGVS